MGWRGERAAARHLRRAGLLIAARNFTCPAGEIDLIAVDHDTVVFVEVKTRLMDDSGQTADVARRVQWPQIVAAARYFLMQRSLQHRPARFDVVVVSWPRRGRPIIEHFVDAHQAPARQCAGRSRRCT